VIERMSTRSLQALATLGGPGVPSSLFLGPVLVRQQIALQRALVRQKGAELGNSMRQAVEKAIRAGYSAAGEELDHAPDAHGYRLLLDEGLLAVGRHALSGDHEQVIDELWRLGHLAFLQGLSARGFSALWVVTHDDACERCAAFMLGGPYPPGELKTVPGVCESCSCLLVADLEDL
jgi:hypothetical protein